MSFIMDLFKPQQPAAAAAPVTNKGIVAAPVRQANDQASGAGTAAGTQPNRVGPLGRSGAGGRVASRTSILGR